mmetsp:Transcript_12257/g.24998  ORF Transcript_12257/g.24998 Transcript_12257/m.24998 type:complete len:94 (-) Transcript_12257:114-395(-)
MKPWSLYCQYSPAMFSPHLEVSLPSVPLHNHIVTVRIRLARRKFSILKSGASSVLFFPTLVAHLTKTIKRIMPPQRQYDRIDLRDDSLFFFTQ